MGQSEDVEKALLSVSKYGDLKYPRGSDRAFLCHAANVLAPEVHRLQAQLSQEIEARKKAEEKSETDHKLFLVAHRDNMEGALLLAKMRTKIKK